MNRAGNPRSCAYGAARGQHGPLPFGWMLAAIGLGLGPLVGLLAAVIARVVLSRYGLGP